MSQVKLVHITPDVEKHILYCARVSSDQKNENTGLIKYLIKHKHWSPFEMASMCVEIQTSRAIAHQILRHRSFSFQEFSQRYAEAQEFEDIKPRRQAEKNRQSSVDDLSEDDRDWWELLMSDAFSDAEHNYKLALERGIAREVARFLLPEATLTKMYMHGTIRSWLHYVDLRMQEDTQEEHREIALAVKRILYAETPTIHDAMWK